MSLTRPVALGLPRGRMLLVVTGALSASLTPGWVEAIRHWYPDVEVRVLVTARALTFVTPTMLRVASGRPELGPGWPDAVDGSTVPHRELAGWADVVVVLPASGNSVAKMAAGIADSFALAVVQNARCPVVVVPAVSPDVAVGPIFRDNVERLRRYGFVIMETVPGRSASSGSLEPGAPAPLPGVLLAVARSMRAEGEDEQAAQGR